MADFRRVYDGDTASIEGGYADLPGDSGGRTWKGISENNNPDWEGWRVINAIVLEEPALVKPQRRGELNQKLHANGNLDVLTFNRMKSRYWDVFWGDRNPSQTVAAELYDQAVHFGENRAVEHLQRVLNALNRKGESVPDVLVDGDYGPQTHAALEIIVARGGETPIGLYLNCLQGARYLWLVERQPNGKFEDWIWGFSRRL